MRPQGHPVRRSHGLIRPALSRVLPVWDNLQHPSTCPKSWRPPFMSKTICGHIPVFNGESHQEKWRKDGERLKCNNVSGLTKGSHKEIAYIECAEVPCWEFEPFPASSENRNISAKGGEDAILVDIFASGFRSVICSPQDFKNRTCKPQPEIQRKFIQFQNVNSV